VKTCVIHIGYPKTGTTALQQYFFEHADVLAQACGIQYFKAVHNHSHLMLLFGCPPWPILFSQENGLFDPKKRQDYEAFLYRELLKQAEACTEPYFLLSGEALCRLRVEDLEQLKVWLSPYFDRFQIVCYVREPRSYITSKIQQLIRVGLKTSQIDPKTLHISGDSVADRPDFSLRPNYRNTLEKFISVFGKANLSIFDYSALRYSGSEIVEAFFRQVFSIDKLPVKSRTKKTNVSTGQTAALILDRVNQHWPTILEGQLNPTRGSIHALDNTQHGKQRPFAVQDGYFDTKTFAGILSDDITWLKAATDGRVNYSSSIPSEPAVQDVDLFESQSEHEIEILDFSAEVINTLSRDLEKSNRKSVIYRECMMFRHMPERSQKVLENAIIGIGDSAFLLTTAHLLRLEGRMGLAVLALECAQNCVDKSDDAQILKISTSLAATHAMMSSNSSA
jgi:hypothetical protein